MTSRLAPAPPLPVSVLGRLPFHVRDPIGDEPRSPCQGPWSFSVVPFFSSFEDRRVLLFWHVSGVIITCSALVDLLSRRPDLAYIPRYICTYHRNHGQALRAGFTAP